ncbi:MAG: serine--tRNA ligase, partial [Methylocystis sp.]|nr:serine--tRNA ligase [Methylocystis sp.]
MYDIKWIRDNAAVFEEGRERRGLEPLSERLFELDDARRAAIAKLQAAQERRNAASKEIGLALREKNQARAEELKAEVARIKDDFPKWEQEEREAVAALDMALSYIPNIPLDSVPDGDDEYANVEVSRWGEPRKFDFAPPHKFDFAKEHFDIGEGLGMMDFEAAAKLSGARFVVIKGPLARLERALAQFMLDLHTSEHGYTEVNPPLLVREDAMFGTAQLPKFYDDQFSAARKKTHVEFFNEVVDHITEDERAQLKAGNLSFEQVLDAALERAPTQECFWLIPTAEVPLTNLVRESILDEAQLPLRLTAGTYCFRAEAGAAGKDTRGMIRQHQFYKVELVSITTPEQSLAEHERMTACAEKVLQLLELPYRKVNLCTGDLGFASQKTYDLEVWLPGQGKYREISSCS